MDGLEQEVSGVEAANAADSQVSEGEATETTATAEPVVDERVEAAFAKRLAAERTKIDQEYAERYKDYDKLVSVSDYFRELNEAQDLNDLSERIEYERLSERATAAQLPPEVQQRLEQLEARAAEADQLREQQNTESWYRNFRNELDKFATERNVEANALEQYMLDNGLGNMEIAYKAMTFPDAEEKLKEIEDKRKEIIEQGVKDYLESKRSPKVMGAGSAAQLTPNAPRTWAEARAGALEMLRNANKPV